MYIVTFTAHQQRHMVRTPHFFGAGDATVGPNKTSPCSGIYIYCSVISSYLLGDPPARIPNSPSKKPKIQKKLKNASNLPPRYVFPPEPGV